MCFRGFLVPFQVYQQAALSQKAEHIKTTLYVLLLGEGHIHSSLIHQTLTFVSDFFFYFGLDGALALLLLHASPEQVCQPES